MASREQLEEALIKAHEAGDTEAAQLFASEIKALTPKRSTFDKLVGGKDVWLNPENWKKVGRDTLRIGADALGAFPNAAADAGVAARNMIMGSDYELPSQAYSKALDDVGLKAPQTGLEKGINIAGQMLLGSRLPAPQAAKQAPAAFNPQAMRTVALKKAQDAGLVIPPSTTNPTVLNRFLESWGGKTATAQDAGVKNQPVIDALVKSDLGLKATDDVAAGTMPQLRAEAAAKGYAPVKNVGTIRLDGQYSKALDDIAAPYLKSEKAFPGLNKNDIASTVESLKQKSVDSDTAISTLQIVRDKADAAYRAGDTALGKAYKSMAKELESAVERSLERRGADAKQMLTDFRAARQLIAKTHSAEKALNPELGHFDALKLAQQLNHGKPLSGGMKKAGQAAQAFKEATKLRTDSGGVRNLDTAFGALGAVGADSALPLLYPFSRMAARDFLLSPAGQRLAVPRAQYGTSPEVLMGGAHGLLGVTQ